MTRISFNISKVTAKPMEVYEKKVMEFEELQRIQTLQGYPPSLLPRGMHSLLNKCTISL